MSLDQSIKLKSSFYKNRGEVVQLDQLQPFGGESLDSNRDISSMMKEEYEHQILSTQ